MTYQLVWVGAVSLLAAWTAPSVAGGGPALTGPVAVAIEGNAGGKTSGESDERVWGELGTDAPGRGIWLDVTYPEEPSTDRVFLFDCTAHQYDDARVDRLQVQLGIRDAAGTVLHEDTVRVALRDGEDTCRLSWDLSAAPPGAYTARLTWRDRPEYWMGWREYVVRKVSLAAMRASLGETADQVSRLQTRLADQPMATQGASYARMQAAIAEDSITSASAAFAQQRFRQAEALLRYARTGVEAAEAGWVFGALAPERAGPASKPDLGTLEVRDGAFYAEGQPVFLLGWGGPGLTAQDIARLRRYGLNLAVLRIAPRDTLTGEATLADVPARYDALFREAEKQNVSVMVDLAPAVLPAWALEQWPAMVNDALGGVDLTHPAARALIERHVRALLPYLANQRMVNSVCVLERPRFRYAGEAVQQGFLDVVKTLYPDRHALNRSWKAHLATFDDIDISRGHQPHEYQEKAAFRYDWQTYHQQLGTAFVDWLTALTRSLAPEVPVHVRFAGTLFEPGETRWGVDYEALAALTDFSGCMIDARLLDPHYALLYPRQAAHYTLLRSLAPDKPLVNMDYTLASFAGPPSAYTAAYAHSILWDAAIAGLNASALRTWTGADAPEGCEDGLAAHPRCLEGYAQAGLDLNRLGPIVVAFQQAPADLAIVWSRPSKIFDDGVPYLSSTRDAFEGCSFSGYKVRFVTQDRCVETGLAGVKVVVIPEMPALSDAAFAALQDYVAQGGVAARLGTPIPYNERGHSRHDLIGSSKNTILVRGVNLPTEYLHAMDAIAQLDVLEPVPRSINAHGYPLEGVKTRYVETGGEAYLYLLNLRKEAVQCFLTGPRQSGRDLIQGRNVAFPMVVAPLDPMLIRLAAPPE